MRVSEVFERLWAREPAPTSAPVPALPEREHPAVFERLSVEEPSPAPAPVPAIPDREHPQNYERLLDEVDVRLSSLFGLAVHTIVIDPGHGGRDPGAIGASGTREKDLTLDIALRLRDRLKENGPYNVVLTREVDKKVTPSKRVEFANANNADLFVSIHINSLPQKPLNVIETYYFGPPQDEETLRLAEKENQGSEYSLEGFRAIIEKIGDTLKRQESIALAWSIQRSLFTNIREYDADVQDVGVKVAPFVVLLGVDAPAVLAEVSCITNDEEEVKLNSPDYREKIASFLEDGIISYLNRRHVHAKGEEEHEQSTDG
jgi:N-acetylmuramoyl-L-alanine amidase